MDRGRGSTRPYRSFSRGGRGGFRGSGRSRGGTGRGFYSRRDDGPSFPGGSRSRGDNSYSDRRRDGGERFREAPSTYPAREYDRPVRRTLTPPLSLDRSRSNGGPTFDRDSYRFERNMMDHRPPLRDSLDIREYRAGPRDFDDRRDYPGYKPALYADMLDYPSSRDYSRLDIDRYGSGGVGPRRRSLEMRDVGGRRDIRDMSPPRRGYDPWPRSRGFGSRGAVASTRSYPDDSFVRRGPSPAFNDRPQREVRTRRLSPQFDRDGPPMKRSRGRPPSVSRDRPRGRGGFAPRRSGRGRY